MSETQTMPVNDCRLGFDVSAMEAQIAEFSDLLALRSPDLLQGDLAYLCEDVVLGKFESTLGADNIVDVRCVLNFGSRFENILAALRTQERDDFIRSLAHASQSTTERE